MNVPAVTKRLLDVALSTGALLITGPVIVITAAAVRLTMGRPAFFRQERIGLNDRAFVIYKIRTMSTRTDDKGVLLPDEARLTSVGRFIRALSLDELPQLWNVLKGDMSLIGPRPHALAHDNYFETLLSDYAFRHHVKPGITGWAQCNGARGATPSVEHIAERVKLDLWYINNWSLWLDLLITIRTVIEVLRKRNAY